MTIKTLVIITFSLFSAVSVADESVCISSSADYLDLDYQSFDQTIDGGWRAVEARPNCEGEAADLIHLYAEVNQEELSAGDQRTLRWHEGQLRAANGETSAAVELFKQSYQENTSSPNPWNLYVDATIAFLQKDRAALLKARRDLAAIPKPKGFDPRDADGNPVDVPWPPNLHVVDQLMACFGAAYSEAYGDCEAN